MKIKLLCFSLVLLATGGSLFAQRPISIVGGVVTANVADTNDFQVILSANVTGVTLVSTTGTSNNAVTPSTGYQVTMRFVQDATGSRTVAFGGNISTSCTVNATALSVTICRWQYTASGNTWADSGSGSGSTFVSSLAATCTPGVTSNVVGSASITANNQVYPAGQEFFCAGPPAAANTWSPISGSIDPGVFNTTTTISTQASPHVFAVNSDQQCPTRVYNDAFGALNGVGLTDTDALDGCIVVPASGVTNAVSTGVQGWAYNLNGTAGGQFGFTAAVGLGGFTACKPGTTGANAKCWSVSGGAQSFAGATNPSSLNGVEMDITAQNNTDTGITYLASLRGAGTATANNMVAFGTQALNTNKYTVGYHCFNGSIATSGNTYPYGCLVAGDSNDGSHDSLEVYFIGGNTATCATPGCHVDMIQLSDDFFRETSRVHIIGRAAGTGTGSDAGYGIQAKATASLATNVLVKIDTANADSWVICTTADTFCPGATASAAFCVASATGCPVITVPGSKVELLLGTGTCAIGNHVIVDTTTNGRIKCQAGIPAQGAWIGTALSAQATVGNAVDVLTRFQ